MKTGRRALDAFYSGRLILGMGREARLGHRLPRLLVYSGVLLRDIDFHL